MDPVRIQVVPFLGLVEGLGGGDVPGCRVVELLGLIQAGGAHDVPLPEFGFQVGVVDGMGVPVQGAAPVEFAQDAADAPGPVDIGYLPVA